MRRPIRSAGSLLAALAMLSSACDGASRGTGEGTALPDGSELASPPREPDLRPPEARGFDFLFGRWDIHNRVLRERLKGSTQWDEWDARLDVVPILFGMGQVDRFRPVDPTESATPYEGNTLRLYDPAEGAWRLYWMDSGGYRLLPQVSGPMGPEGGTFFGEEEFEGDTVQLRFRWMHTAADSAYWDQAYQLPDGEWEINWTMDFVRR